MDEIVYSKRDILDLWEKLRGRDNSKRGETDGSMIEFFNIKK